MKVIPAIDLLNGKCVRLLKGNYNEVEIFHHDPVELANMMEAEGIKYLHLVDLDGARASGSNFQILEQISTKTNLKIDFGGGIRNLNKIKTALDAGASQVNIGSMAVKETSDFIKAIHQFGEAIIWNADLKKGKLAIHGWVETVEQDFHSLLQIFQREGLKWVLSTDISKDGTMEGANISFYKEMILNFPDINWIASGGVNSKEDLIRLKNVGLAASVVGKAFYSGALTYEDLTRGVE